MRQSKCLSAPQRGVSARRQRGFLSSRQALVVLGLIFMAPAFVAWVVHSSGDGGWRPEWMTNRGSLVHPARPLTMPADLQHAAGSLNDYLQGKWTLLYIGDADCDAVCQQNLYKLRQIRVAQNENMIRVQTLFLVTADSIPGELGAFLEKEHPETAVVILSAAQAQQVAADFLIDAVPMQGAERTYIIDPLGNLMMYYPPDAEPSGMLLDLKKLLKFSKIG
jgi:cytochrome oxidase Cu insertion factor (SCO1/SenC/PrrC family)